MGQNAPTTPLESPQTDSGSTTGRPTGSRSPRIVLIAVALILLAALMFATSTGALAPRAVSPDATGPATPTDQFYGAVGAVAQLLPASPIDLGTMVLRLLLAAVLGAAISFRGSRRRNEFQVVHTSIILAFTGAMMMIVVGSDLARAFGLVGASSIVRYRTPVHDPKALASLFVSMGAGIAVGVGFYELAIVGTILVILVDLTLERGGLMLSGGWYRSERAYELNIETDTPDETLRAVRQVFEGERISHMLVDYDRGKKGDNVKMGLSVGLPERADTEKLTLQILGAGARSVSWRIAKDQ